MQYNLQNSLLTSLEISKKSGFKKPNSWPNIRKNIHDNCISLLVDDRYPIGFAATVTGGYSVDIDGEPYADYSSGAQFAVADWADYSATDGYSISYPDGASTAHIIDIYPQTEGENITQFKCQRVAESGTEEQGVLWVHFNLSNAIMLEEMLYNDVINRLCSAITAKGDKITLTSIYGWASGIYSAFTNCYALEYLPAFVTINEERTYWQTFKGTAVKTVKLMQGKSNSSSYDLFNGCRQLEQVKGNFVIIPTERTFKDCRSIKKLPAIDAANSTNMDEFLTNAAALEDTVLDVSAAAGLTKITCFGTAEYFMGGFKGLRVSNSAPFSGTTPQINVSYTGMDRAALVQLFNDLPTVTDNQTVNITGCIGTSSLSEDDKAIATDKGWLITE